MEENVTPSSAIPFAAYKGSGKYIFISYAHKDSAQVYPIITRFHQQEYNVWYDEGIEPGIEWPEEIANALDGSSLFVVFITPNSVASENVRNEINFALAQKMPFIAIYLCATSLTPGLQLQIGSKQAILQYQMDADAFERKYRYSFDTIFNPGKREPEKPAVPPITATAPEQKAPEPAPAAAKSEPPAAPPDGALSFKSDLIRQAACAEIGLPPERHLEAKHCVAVTKLKLYADAFGAHCLAADKRSGRLMLWRKNDSPQFFHEPGSITDISDIAYFTNLRELTLIYQRFSDLSALSGLPIKVLDLSINKLGSLTPLASLQQMISLYLDHASYESLLPLDGLEALAYLSNFAIAPAAFSDLCSLRLPGLLHLTLSESKLESLAGISNLKSVNWLELQNCVIFEYDDIANLKNIDTLSLLGCKVFDYSFLKELPNLKTLSVDAEQKQAITEQFGTLPPYIKF